MGSRTPVPTEAPQFSVIWEDHQLLALTPGQLTVALGLGVFTVALSGLFIVARFEVLAGERSSHCSVVGVTSGFKEGVNLFWRTEFHPECFEFNALLVSVVFVEYAVVVRCYFL